MTNDEDPEMSDVCDLKILEQLSLKVVEASPDAKIVINESGSIVIFNAQAELLFGYAREDVLGKPIEMLLCEDRRVAHVAHRTGYFESPRVREMGEGRVLQGRHWSGKLFPIEIKLAPLSPVTGAGVHALAVVRRVSKRQVDAAIQSVKSAENLHDGAAT